MNDPKTIPSLPTYLSPNQFAEHKQAGMLNKVLSRMLFKRLPRLNRKGKTHSSHVKIKHKKVKYY